MSAHMSGVTTTRMNTRHSLRMREGLNDKLSQSERLSIFKAIKASHPNLVHWFSDQVEVTKAIDSEAKGSASATVIVFAVAKSNPGMKLFIKMGFGPALDELHYEREIYAKVATKLVEHQVTPCVVPMLAYFRVDGLYNNCGRMRNPSPSVQKVCTAIRKSRKMSPEAFSVKNVKYAHVLFTEASDGLTLADQSEDDDGKPKDNWAKHSHTEEEWRDVLFQLYYTLQSFVEVGLVHWDLHGGNVFIDRNPNPQRTAFMISKDRVYICKPKWLVKIYDFDRSYKMKSPYPGFTGEILNKAIISPTSGYNYLYGQEFKMDPGIDIMRINTALFEVLLSKSKPGQTSAMDTKLMRILKSWTNMNMVRCLTPENPQYSTPEEVASRKQKASSCNINLRKEVTGLKKNVMLSFPATACYKSIDSDYYDVCTVSPAITKRLTQPPINVIQNQFFWARDIKSYGIFRGTSTDLRGILSQMNPEHVFSLPSAQAQRQKDLGQRGHLPDIRKRLNKTTGRAAYPHLMQLRTRKTVNLKKY